MFRDVAGEQRAAVGDDEEGGAPVVRLALALVRVQGVAGRAAAVVALAALPALRVDALLAAHPGRRALVHVHTRLRVVESLAAGTRAQRPSRGLHAPVAAARLGAAAVVQLAVRPLVRAVRAVRLPVADARQRDADVRRVRVGTPPRARPTRQPRGVTRVLRLVLVAPVAAVVLAVADVGVEHALVVGALEVVAGTVDGAAGAGLVAAVLAVGGAVAVPALGHADPALLALELGLRVALVGRQHGAALLVAAVVTVRDAVTLVRLVDALLQVAALELGGGAGDGRAALLVRVVEAVVVAVAAPALRDAGAAGAAGELEVLAGLDAAAVALVRRVAAVVLAVALPCERDAAAVTAAEL